jgi:hypothetical protein
MELPMTKSIIDSAVIKYSPVAPISVLQGLYDRNILGDYLLLLAHDVIKNPYAYEEMVEVVMPSTIIMDNGVIENGTPVSLDELMEAASIVDADIVVGPDMVGDFVGTKKLMIEQADFILENYQLMLIPQGDSYHEICECIRWMDERFHTVGDMWWGIPRWITNKLGSRSAPITYINNYCRAEGQTNIHLLGMSKNLDDDIMCAKTLSVRGIDSANPLVCGWLGYSIQHGVHHDRGIYWEECKEVTDLMAQNVEFIRHAINT